MTGRHGHPYDRFERFVLPDPNSGCWLWTGNLIDGYGRLRVGKTAQRAHRIAWSKHVGPIPDGLHVLHKCDNRACANPAHLFLGTNNDNVADRVAKNRTADMRGERNPRAKISLDTAQQIALDTSPITEIMARYGVTRWTVRSIKKGQSWGGLLSAPPSPSRRACDVNTPETVRAIRAATGPQKLIAAAFGVSQMTVSLIKRRKVWKNVD